MFLKSYGIEGKFGSKVVHKLDDRWMKNLAFIYNYMKDKKGY